MRRRHDLFPPGLEPLSGRIRASYARSRRPPLSSHIRGMRSCRLGDNPPERWVRLVCPAGSPQVAAVSDSIGSTHWSRQAGGDLRHSVVSVLLARGVTQGGQRAAGPRHHRAHVGHLQPHHPIASAGSRRRHGHCHPRSRRNAASTGRYGRTMAEPGAERSGRILASSTLTWPDVVGRDGIEPPTLRFSAARSTD